MTRKKNQKKTCRKTYRDRQKMTRRERLRETETCRKTYRNRQRMTRRETERDRDR